MVRSLPVRLRPALLIVLPALAIFAARWFTHSNWAAENAGITAILFAWVVADALMLALLAKSEANRPEAYAVIAVLALASLIILVGAGAPVRDIYLGMPQVLIAAGGTIALFLVWSCARIAGRYRATGSARLALESVFPPLQVKFMMSEARVIWLGLLRWNASVDVPHGSQPFAYHSYLVPMIATILALQIIEIGVVHFLVMMWSPTAAWVLFALSLYGIIWTMALLKSLRIYPVLVREQSIRVRCGILYDFKLPLSAIDAFAPPLSQEELASKRVLNLALLSAPNISLRLREPIAIPTMLGGSQEIDAIALRLDDSGGFLKEMSRAD